MTLLQVTLPDNLKKAAEVRAKAGGYGSVDCYLASLIEADQLAPLTGELEAELLKGVASGPAVAITPQFITDLKTRVRQARTAA